jgi:hypothetical protein
LHVQNNHANYDIRIEYLEYEQIYYLPALYK